MINGATKASCVAVVWKLRQMPSQWTLYRATPGIAAWPLIKDWDAAMRSVKSLRMIKIWSRYAKMSWFLGLIELKKLLNSSLTCVVEVLDQEAREGSEKHFVRPSKQKSAKGWKRLQEPEKKDPWPGRRGDPRFRNKPWLKYLKIPASCKTIGKPAR